MDAGAAVAVSARAHLQVEGAVDLVLLGSEDLGEVLRHLSQVVLAGRRRAVSTRAHARARGEPVARADGRIVAVFTVVFYADLCGTGIASAAKLGCSQGEEGGPRGG